MNGLAIELLLSYIYFGVHPSDPEVAAQLLSFAYEYGVQGLMYSPSRSSISFFGYLNLIAIVLFRSVCERVLRDNIDVQTVLFILQVSLHPQANAVSLLRYDESSFHYIHESC